MLLKPAIIFLKPSLVCEVWLFIFFHFTGRRQLYIRPDGNHMRLGSNVECSQTTWQDNIARLSNTCGVSISNAYGSILHSFGSESLAAADADYLGHDSNISRYSNPVIFVFSPVYSRVLFATITTVH